MPMWRNILWSRTRDGFSKRRGSQIIPRIHIIKFWRKCLSIPIGCTWAWCIRCLKCKSRRVGLWWARCCTNLRTSSLRCWMCIWQTRDARLVPLEINQSVNYQYNIAYPKLQSAYLTKECYSMLCASRKKEAYMPSPSTMCITEFLVFYRAHFPKHPNLDLWEMHVSCFPIATLGQVGLEYLYLTIWTIT